MNETHTNGFSWQEGYALSRSEFRKRLVRLTTLSERQSIIKRRSFKQEFLVFLEKRAIDYDPKYVWG